MLKDRKRQVLAPAWIPLLNRKDFAISTVQKNENMDTKSQQNVLAGSWCL